jgi:hypothetical protein
MKNKSIYIALLLISIGSSVFADQFRTISDVTGKLTLSRQPAETVVSMTAGQTIPNVALGTVFVTGINTGATAIAGLSNAITGNVITIVGKSTTTSNATTIADSAPFYLNGAFTASANSVLRLLIRGASDYVELGRSAN